MFKRKLCGLVLAVPLLLSAKAPKIPDAPTADGSHYTVEFENADVRVLRIKFPPHSNGVMHDHPHSVTAFFTGGTLRFTTPDGKSGIATGKPRTFVYEEAGPHKVDNVGDEPFEAVRIELKK